jgi:hypothetical protein
MPLEADAAAPAHGAPAAAQPAADPAASAAADPAADGEEDAAALAAARAAERERRANKAQAQVGAAHSVISRVSERVACSGIVRAVRQRACQRRPLCFRIRTQLGSGQAIGYRMWLLHAAGQPES